MQWHFKQVPPNKRKDPSLFVLTQTIDTKDILLRCVIGQREEKRDNFLLILEKEET